MEFAFKHGIWEFLIHDLTPVTQLLPSIGYGTDINILCIEKNPFMSHKTNTVQERWYTEVIGNHDW